MEKRIEVKFKELHRHKGKVEATEFCVSGIFKREEDHIFISFKEPQMEYIDGLIREISYNKDGAKVVRRSENNLIYSVTYFNTHDKSVGFYDMPSQPIHSSDFKVTLKNYDCSDEWLKMCFNLYVDGYFIGSYETKIVIGEVKDGNS